MIDRTVGVEHTAESGEIETTVLGYDPFVQITGLS